MMDYYSHFLNALDDTELEDYRTAFEKVIQEKWHPECHGDFARWEKALAALPQESCSYDIKADTITVKGDFDSENLRETLMNFHPWRKGPFQIGDVFIDTEWRSDWKWQRLASEIKPLAGKRVLDIGCGNGYHCWRMAGQGAKMVIGVDPFRVYVMQYHVLRHFIKDVPVHVLPLGMEELPEMAEAFDTVFSMGVLYHRRSPMDHLLDLMNFLKPGGELVLETLIVEDRELLVPPGRYAQMRNVWFLPSVEQILSWLKKAGYKNARCIDVTKTSFKEQRSTDWMTFQSLKDFLNPDDPDKTAEGHPAPVRAVILAEA